MKFHAAILLFAFASAAQALLYTPANLTITERASGVALEWDLVEGAKEYVITLNNGQTETVTMNKANFGSLMPSTTYTGSLVASDGNETQSAPNTFTFTTLIGKVTGIVVREVTTTSFDIMWQPVNNSIQYDIRVTSEDDELGGMNIIPSENSALITGLQGVTFYDIFITPVGIDGDGEETMIRLRSEGTGVRITNWWSGSSGIFGGIGMIYRPVNIPSGVYKIGVQLPCAVQYIKFWGAKQDMDQSDPENGYYELVQSKPWMLRKTEVGMNFIFQEEMTCDFVNTSIVVRYGDEVGNPGATPPGTTKEIEIDQYQWQNITEGVAFAAGWCKFRLDKMFHGVNWGDDVFKNKTIEKPGPGTFVLTLNTGPGCPGGIMIKQQWGMTLKDTTTMPGATDNMLYFIQADDTMWHNAKPGFIYGYDATVCDNQFTFSGQAMLGGAIVDAVMDEPDKEVSF